VIYHHDHSDTLRDNIHLSLLLEPGDVLLCNITLPVHVQPVNDEPFSLSTAAPHISVVQGQTVVIPRENLLTEDPDTSPDGLIYDVISGPSQGRLLFRNETTNNMTPVVRFTQADIDAGHMLYQHYGPLQPSTFYFRVWDGQFNPVYTVFNIHVLPLALNVTVGAPVMLQQGSSVAVITADHLLAVTNARTEEVGGYRQPLARNSSKNKSHSAFKIELNVG
jgi:chondroitin sulfate proteoglycan 4